MQDQQPDAAAILQRALSLPVRERKELVASLAREKRLREARRLQSDLGEQYRAGGLLEFVRYFWHLLEPNTPLVEGMPMRAVCLHLEAVTRGEIKRLIINVSPGSAKSLLVNVFWPLWEWSAGGLPWIRYVTFAYAAYLTERDNLRFRDIIRSPEFQELWGHVFTLTSEGQTKPMNDKTGWKFSSSMKGVGTGERGHRILADDLHNVKEGESEAILSETVRWAREGMSNRLNDMEQGAIVLIGQQVNEDDVSNTLLKLDLGYIHLSIPNEYDPARHCATDWWEDPRTEDGELAWPERFPAHVVAQIKRTLGPHAYAAQYQQSPEPRGGGIIKRDWWGVYPLELGQSFRHEFEFILASLDPAFTAKQENDPSGFTVWGVYHAEGETKCVLLHAWQKWLELHGQTQERLPGEDNKAYTRRTSPHWGLVEWVVHDCARLKVHKLLIEDKASGHSVVQELRRLYGDNKWHTQLYPAGNLDKRARAYAVQHLFADGMIEAPASSRGDMAEYREWAQMTIDECAKFRGLQGDEDNLVDSATQALKFMRDNGLLLRVAERDAMEKERRRHKGGSTRDEAIKGILGG